MDRIVIFMHCKSILSCIVRFYFICYGVFNLKIFAIFLAALTTAATVYKPYSLDQAVMDALSFDGRISAAVSSLEVAKEGVNQVFGLNLPSISGIGEFDYQKTKDFNPFGTSQRNGPRGYAGVQLNQQLFTFGRQSSKQKRASAEVTRVSSVVIQTKADVALETISVFFETLLIQDINAIHERHANTLAQLEEATEAKFKTDLMTSTDLLLVKSRHQQAKAKLTTSKANLSSSRNRLLSLTGIDFSSLQAFNPGRLKSFTLTLDDALEMASLYVPELTIAEAEILSAKADVELEAAELNPNVSLRGQFSRGEANGLATGSDSIGFSLNVPLYNGGIQRSRARASKHRLNQVQRQATFTLQQARQRITGAWHQTRGSEDAYKAWETALDSELKSLEGIQEEVDEGIRPITYLLEARDQAVEVEVQSARAKKDHYITKFSYLKEAGRLLEALNFQASIPQP